MKSSAEISPRKFHSILLFFFRKFMWHWFNLLTPHDGTATAAAAWSWFYVRLWVNDVGRGRVKQQQFSKWKVFYNIISLSWFHIFSVTLRWCQLIHFDLLNFLSFCVLCTNKIINLFSVCCSDWQWQPRFNATLSSFFINFKFMVSLYFKF